MKFCIIGIGRFGLQLAKSLTQNGMDVLAIDKDEDRIELIKNHVTQAIVMNMVDEESLKTMGIEEMNAVIIAIGRNFAHSVLLTRILKRNLGIERVIVRSTGDMQRDILELVGADQVILPEQEAAILLADNLSSSFMDIIHVSPTFSIVAILAPDEFVDKTLEELAFYNTYNINCIAIKRNEETIIPTPETIIHDHDILYFAGNNNNVKKLGK